MKKCKIDECDIVMQTRRGFCKRHYRAFMKYGDPLFKSQTSRVMPLWDRVLFYGWTENEKTGCWDWNGSTRKGGYGRISYEGQGLVVTRVVLERELGRILDPKEFVLHSCDRPICVNPAHLRPGNTKDNTRDMLERGRGNPPRGEINGNAKLTVEKVREIRSRRGNGETGVSLAREFDVSPSLISHICKRQKWSHVD